MPTSHWITIALSVAALVATSGCCCAETTTVDYLYVGASGMDHSSVHGDVYLSMTSTRTRPRDDPDGASVVNRDPYTLLVLAKAPIEPAAPLRVVEARLEHRGKAVTLHERSAPPLESPWTFAPHANRYGARLEIPLGEHLPWVEGSTAKIRVDVVLPWLEKELSIERVYTTKKRIFSGSAFDALMGV